MEDTPFNNPSETTKRQEWLSVISKSSSTLVNELWTTFPNKPTWKKLRSPEIGMVMVRGKAGGGGMSFNLGEMTVTRAAIRLANGIAGVGYVKGRSKDHAEICAVLDAMLQDSARNEETNQLVIDPLRKRLFETAQKKSRKAANTKVEFFTMVRGD